jgi:hypothetical protein
MPLPISLTNGWLNGLDNEHRLVFYYPPTSVVDPHWLQCGSGSRESEQCGFGTDPAPYHGQNLKSPKVEFILPKNILYVGTNNSS